MTVCRLGNGSRLLSPALPLPESVFDLPDDRNEARSNRRPLAAFISVFLPQNERG